MKKLSSITVCLILGFCFISLPGQTQDAEKTVQLVEGLTVEINELLIGKIAYFRQDGLMYEGVIASVAIVISHDDYSAVILVGYDNPEESQTGPSWVRLYPDNVFAVNPDPAAKVKKLSRKKCAMILAQIKGVK